MKKIQFTNHIFDKQNIKFENNLAIIIADNRSGKTEILNTLEQGLKGKINDFYVDEQKVHHDSFQVIYLEEYFSLKENLKLNKTSTLRNLLIQNINKNINNSNQKKYQEIIRKLTELHENFHNLLNDSSISFLNKNDDINNSLALKANLEIFSINNIIDKLLKIQIINNETKNIIDEENYSHFMLRILLFNILKNSLDFNDKLRPTIILIDLPELYGTPKIIFKLNKWFHKLLNNNITLIIVSNSPEYLISLRPSLTSINLINTNHILTIENLSTIIKDAIILFSFWESNQRDLITYKNSLFSLIDDEDIKNEIKYIDENIFECIIKSLFAEEINLTVNKLNNISTKKYIIQHVTSIRNLIFIYTILLSGFNINSIWNSEDINDFEKINSYFN